MVVIKPGGEPERTLVGGGMCVDGSDKTRRRARENLGWRGNVCGW